MDLEKQTHIAINYFKKDYNCAQSVIKAFSEAHNLETGGIVKAASSLGSGLKSGCACGSLTGAELMVGFLFSKNPKKLEEKTKILHNEFRNKFGSTCCRVIRGKDNKLCEDTIKHMLVILNSLII